MSNKKIGIVGFGYVGKSMYDLFKDHFEIEIYDKFIEKYSGEYQKNLINCCDLAIVCVPTPSLKNGSVDTSIVAESIKWIKASLILIKSTIPPGTCEEFVKKTNKQIVFSPENVGEGKYEIPYWKGYPHPTDIKKHEFIIIGGERENCNKVLEYFKKVMGPFVKYQITDFKTAEMTKYVINSYLAMLVTFCNEIYEISKAAGINYNELRELFLLDKRLSRTHSLVFEDNRGYGGKCLPKDIKGLSSFASIKGYQSELLNQIIKSNEKFNQKNINNGI